MLHNPPKGGPGREFFRIAGPRTHPIAFLAHKSPLVMMAGVLGTSWSHGFNLIVVPWKSKKKYHFARTHTFQLFQASGALLANRAQKASMMGLNAIFGDGLELEL